MQGDKPVQFGVGETKGQFRGRLQVARVACIYIVLIALGEAKGEHSPLGVSVEDHCAKTAGPAGARPRNPLLDDAPAKIGVNEAFLSPLDRIA